jgi:hypothetical protein
MKKVLVISLCTLVLGGCQVKKTEEADGDSKISVEPAKVEVGTDTQTVKVPTIDIVPDSADTTTTR